MLGEEGLYPEHISLPQYKTAFGEITIEFDEACDSFIISFEALPLESSTNYFEGSVEVRTNPDDFDEDKLKLVRTILAEINTPQKNGAQLQINLLAQLRSKFSLDNVNVDKVLVEFLES